MKFNIHSASVTKFIVESGSDGLDDCIFPTFIRIAYKNDTISIKRKKKLWSGTMKVAYDKLGMTEFRLTCESE